MGSCANLLEIVIQNTARLFWENRIIVIYVDIVTIGSASKNTPAMWEAQVDPGVEKI